MPLAGWAVYQDVYLLFQLPETFGMHRSDRTEKTPEKDPTPTPPSIPAEASLLTPLAASNRRPLSKPPLIFTENPQPGTNMTTSHRDRSPPSGVHSRLTPGFQLVKIPLTSPPARTFKVPTNRTPNTPFQPRCRVIPKSQPLTNMPSAEFSAWGVTRPQVRNRGHRIGLLLLLGAILATLTVIC